MTCAPACMLKQTRTLGQGEVDFIAACVIAAKDADNIGAPPEQTKDLIAELRTSTSRCDFSRQETHDRKLRRIAP